MIGIIDGGKYKQMDINLKLGDMLFLTSDGVYEAGESFGINGVANYFINGGANLEELYAQIKEQNPLYNLADDAKAY